MVRVQSYARKVSLFFFVQLGFPNSMHHLLMEKSVFLTQQRFEPFQCQVFKPHLLLAVFPEMVDFFVGYVSLRGETCVIFACAFIF